MKVTVSGKITSVLPKRSGVSKTGNAWASQDYIIMPDGDTDFIVFNVFGEENINKYALQVGAMVSVTLEIKSREYNGKYFSEVRAIQCYSSNVSAPAPASEPTSAAPATNLPF